MSADRIGLVSVFALVAACSGASNLLVVSDAGSEASSSDSGTAGSSSGSGSGSHTTCVPGGSCVDGATMQVCTTTAADGMCESIAYSLLSQTFTCAACTNCAEAQMQASEACAGASSSGSGSGSGSSSGSGSGSGSGGEDSDGGDAGTNCGTPPALHVEPAGTVFCGGAGDGGALFCTSSEECCLGGALGGGTFAPEQCGTFGAACTNVGPPDAGAPAIPVECAQISDCVANGVAHAVACCLQSATTPALVPGCTYVKATMGTAIVCESSSVTTAPAPCNAGETQMCSSQGDCPAGTTCTPGRWKIFQVGFCL